MKGDIMVKMHKLTKGGQTIYPATIYDAVVNPKTRKSLTAEISELERQAREITLFDKYIATNKSLYSNGTLKDAGGWNTYFKIPIIKGDHFRANFSNIPSTVGVSACVIYNSSGSVIETINEKEIYYTFAKDGFVSFCYLNNGNNYFNVFTFTPLRRDIEQLKKSESVYNLDYLIPLSGSYYTSTTARKAVPVDIRKIGLIIIYKTSEKESVTEQFIGSSVANWTDASNWTDIGVSGGKENLDDRVRLLEEFPSTLSWFDKFNGKLSDIDVDLSLVSKTLKDIWFEFPNGKPTWWDSRQPQLRAYNGYGFGEDNDARIIIYFRETTEETYNSTYNFQYRGPRYKGEIEHFRASVKLGGSSEPVFYINIVVDTILLMSISGSILSSVNSQKLQPMILKKTGTLYNVGTNENYIEDAPKDGKSYVRNNGKWVILDSVDNVVPQIFNNPIVRRDSAHKLRLLCFGSSWNMCTWWYLNKIIKSAGIEAEITGFYTGGAYFSQWIDRYNKNESIDCWKSANGSDWEQTTANFKDALNENWDIIEFQQGAYQAIKWDEEWAPYWSELVSIVKRNCNHDTVIAFNSSYTPAINGNLSPYPNTVDGQKLWQQENYINTQKFMALSGIFNVSPGGATIWSLRREPTINISNDLAFDKLHPDNGLPIYALGGTFFETYISPMYGISFDKVEWKPDISIQKTPFNNAWQELNDQQRIKIRKIIKLSLSNRFGFNELVE